MKVQGSKEVFEEVNIDPNEVISKLIKQYLQSVEIYFPNPWIKDGEWQFYDHGHDFVTTISHAKPDEIEIMKAFETVKKAVEKITKKDKQ